MACSAASTSLLDMSSRLSSSSCSIPSRVRLRNTASWRPVGRGEGNTCLLHRMCSFLTSCTRGWGAERRVNLVQPKQHAWLHAAGRSLIIPRPQPRSPPPHPTPPHILYGTHACTSHKHTDTSTLRTPPPPPILYGTHARTSYKHTDTSTFRQTQPYPSPLSPHSL